MTVVDLHPEDLLEKDALGDLEESERSRLEAHLARCSACRMERQLRADFAQELAADDPLDHTVALGIDRIAPLPVAARESRIELRVPRRKTKKIKRAVWLLAAAALLVGGVSAAAMGLNPAPWARAMLASTSAPAVDALTAQKKHAPVHASVAAALPEPAVVPEAPAPLPGVVASPAPSPRSLVQLVQAPARARAAVVQPPVTVGPAEIFESETEARRGGDYARALDRDRDLEGHYPTSREAQVSRVVMGRVLLDRGDPAGAIAKFEAYLGAGSGQLGEEAMVGRATALERLGRTDDAARAWAALVAAFPATPYAAHARARLESSTGR
jgi:TolA-binding protein